MLGFESVAQDERDLILNGKRKRINQFTKMVMSFLRSGEEIVKVTGFDEMDYESTYNSFRYASLGQPVKAVKRSGEVYLVRTDEE